MNWLKQLPWQLWKLLAANGTTHGSENGHSLVDHLRCHASVTDGLIQLKVTSQHRGEEIKSHSSRACARRALCTDTGQSCCLVYFRENSSALFVDIKDLVHAEMQFNLRLWENIWHISYVHDLMLPALSLIKVLQNKFTLGFYNLGD